MYQLTNSSESHSVSTRTEPVLIIVDGPQNATEIKGAYSTGTDVRFRFMFGLFCPSVNGERARIQPVAIAPSSMAVHINELSLEQESPAGLSLTATVSEINQYARYIVGHPVRLTDLITVNRRVRISYNCDNHSGGFVASPREPLINSRSELERIYERGASFYNVSSSVREAPVTHSLQDIDDPAAVRAFLEGTPASVPL